MAERKAFNRADQGLNTKVYMIAVIGAIVLLIVGIYFFVVAGGGKSVPKANQPHPSTQLTPPGTQQTLAG